MRRAWIVLLALLIAYAAIPAPMPTHAQPCRRIVDGIQTAPDPSTAFWVLVQVERGDRAGEWTDYHEYELTGAGWCDMSRPGDVRDCWVNVPALLTRVYAMCAGDYLYGLPEWADWSGWQGDGTPGYSSIDVYLDARFYDGATAHRLSLACDVSPAGDEAVCLRRDRADHFNYIMTDPGPVLALVEGLR